MQHPLPQARQATQRTGLVQIAQQGGQSAGAQQSHALRRRSQCQQTHPLTLRRTELASGAQTHVTATDDEHTRTAKARRQGTERGLV